ncbi:PilN domain-containing protein [Ramlibacter sp.]|uniref:PilN domain-containing protein n=1 Tax=Ramlibacter sp. TaxID=1917967 RepID=UPI001836EB54|nr:PilN domain-containing protein [Ramlibacter sp.]MBA2673399.1 PilN domain-containing protein [Ramlibacter sp.]
MFVRDPFDVAPGASRHTRASWLTLIVGLVFAVFCGSLFEQSLQAQRTAEENVRRQRELLDARARKAAAAQRVQPVDAAALEKMRAQQDLQRILRMSWTGLFDALEAAGQQVEGRATVVSLAPSKTQADAAQVNLTGLAVSNTVLVDYIRALEANPYIRQAQLMAQQPAVSAGAPVVRFQLAVLWDPRGRPMVGPVTAGALAPPPAGVRP